MFNAVKILILVWIQFLFVATSNAQSIYVYNCVAYDGAPLPADEIDQFKKQAELSALHLQSLDEGNRLLDTFLKSANISLGQDYLDRSIAFVRNAQLIRSEQTKISICGIFSGEMIREKKITPEMMSPPPEQPSVPFESNKRYVIPRIVIGLLEGTVWTKAEVEQRLTKLKRSYAGCHIEIENFDFQTMSNPNGMYDNLHMDFLDNDAIVKDILDIELQIGKMISGISQVRPALLYVKNSFDNRDLNKAGNNASDICGTQSFTSSIVVPAKSPIADTAVITENESFSYPGKSCGLYRGAGADFVVEAHELGHILLKDGGHPLGEPNNIMAETGAAFDEAQCAKMRGSPYIRVLPK